MKKIITVILTVILCISCVSCTNLFPDKNIEPQISQLKAISKLATYECIYHDIVKYFKEDAEGIGPWKKDRKFWIEYNGKVKFGIDASKVEMKINKNQVEITIPPAEMQSCSIDSESFTKESFVIDKKSADVRAEHEREALSQAKTDLEKRAANDTVILEAARQRAKVLFENYIKGIGEAANKEYTIVWKELE